MTLTPWDMFVIQTQPPAANPSNLDNRYIRTEVNAALGEMYAAFREEYPDIAWSFISGSRNFSYQSTIWNNKWAACGPNVTAADPFNCCLNILEYSSMPGTSRHHWGTDVDLCSLDNSYFDGGDGKIIFEWWQRHALRFGFAQPYTEQRCAGYDLERWHWSYIKFSLTFLEDWVATYANHMCNYLRQIGFDGSQTCGILAPTYVTTVGRFCKTVNICGTNWLG